MKKQFFKIIGSTLIVGLFLILAFGSEDSKDEKGTSGAAGSSGSSGTSGADAKDKTTALQTVETEELKAEGLSSEFLGNYHGIQPGYFIKNKYGDDMVINGNKVPVPSIDFKFLIKKNNIVSLQQINLEDNSRVYYKGTTKIISDDDNLIKIKCSLSDGQSSSPTYTLSINKTNKTVICIGTNEPEFDLELIK